MKKRSIIKFFVLLFVSVCVVSGIYFAINFFSDSNKNFDLLSIIQNKDTGYNFEKLKSDYPDTIAWIKIDDTHVDFPVVLSDNDFYYLTHNASKEVDSSGAAYIQKSNKPDFSDPVTVIYGHNMLNDDAFSNLIWFQNKQFFDDHPYFYIYVPGHKYIYKIISAYIFDDRHIMNSFDFSDLSIRQKYFDEVCDPKTLVKNIRSGAKLTTDDKIVQLSTCLSDLSRQNQRYIVTGVFLEDCETL